MHDLIAGRASNVVWFAFTVLAAVPACNGSSRLPLGPGAPDATVVDGLTGDAAVARCAGPQPLPEQLEVDGSGGELVVGDYDGDGCHDLAYLVTSLESREVRLDVRWGRSDANNWQTLSAVMLAQRDAVGMRDTGHTLAALSWGGDARPELATALGIVSVSRERELTFTPFAGDPGIAFAPLPVLALPDGARLLRGTNDGAEECTPVGCAPLALPVCAGNVTCPVDEMESGDLDGDGRADVLLGRARDVGIATDGSALTRVFWWHGDDRPVTPITGIDPVDIEIADVDRDGNNDIIAQVREYISDFPSDTVVWRAATGGWQRLQSFTNTDNHNDTMVVADIDGNGCVDWAYVGVDIPSVGVRLGDCQRFADVALRLTATTGVGVQFLDANGDGAGELVIRRERGGYHFLGWAAPHADGR